MALFRRLRYLLNRRQYDQDLASDMEFHREMASREGRQFGSTLRLREESREVWGWTWIDRLAQDLRYAFRMLRRSPEFTVAAVLMLGLGIGVNVAAFGFFNLVLFKPLPVRDPDSLIRLQRRSPKDYATYLSYPEAKFLSDHSKTLSSVIATSQAPMWIEVGTKPVGADFVTTNYLTELGVAPALGRLFNTARDEAADAEPVAVLSYEFWQRYFGGDPSVVGRTIHLNNQPVIVIGVISRNFGGLTLSKPDIWIPIKQQPYFIAGSRLLTDFDYGVGVDVWGRLQPGVTMNAAEQELSQLTGELYKQHPKDLWEKEGVHCDPGGYAPIGNGHSKGNGVPTHEKAMIRQMVGIVGALVLLILAVACANVGSLLLARGAARQREISIRVSVGAGRGRLIRQLLTESLVLAVLGSVAGLVLGAAALRWILAISDAPPWLNPALDWRVIAFTLGITLVAAVLFGLTPALQLAKQRQHAVRMRQFLIGVQVAASCVLLIVAGLLVRALNHAMADDPGFDYAQVVSIDPQLANYGYSAEQAQAYFDQLRNGLSTLPGIDSISLARVQPLGNTTITNGAKIGGRDVEIHVNWVEPEFFHTMKIPIVRGRAFTRGEKNAVLISENLARIQWPGEDAVGKQFSWDMDDAGKPTNNLVVGIAGNARQVHRENADAVESYFPADAADMPSMVLLVKTAGPPEALVSSIGAKARNIDAKVMPDVRMLKSSFREKLTSIETSATVVSMLGGLALVLACLGIVGLLAYAVAQKTKEIGIRMAIGAKPVDILSLVLHQLSWPVILGLVAGVAGAAGLSKLLRSELYGISNLDPLSYFAALALFGIMIALASLLPARRALRVDPIRALRYD
jgi:predicted permease